MANPPVVGYRFRPNDVELIDGYLRPKNLETNTNHVDRIFNTLNISSFDPSELPPQSIMKSEDQVWYFFGRKENKYRTGDRQIRKTKSGFWKKTGKPVIIKRKNGDKIGEKWVLVFHLTKILKTKWTMHEYHLFSPNQVMMPYTVCKVKFEGKASEISSPSGSGETHEHNHSSITEMINNSGGGGELSTGSEVGTSFECPQSEEFDAMLTAIGSMSTDEWNSSLSDYDYEQRKKIMLMQENRNDHRPKKPITGVFIGYSSDDDFDSISATTGCIQTLSTCDDSFGSSNHHVDQTTELQEFHISTIDKVSQPLTQEAEIGESKLGQEKMKNKRAGFFYRTTQKFIKKIQLCTSI